MLERDQDVALVDVTERLHDALDADRTAWCELLDESRDERSVTGHRIEVSVGGVHVRTGPDGCVGHVEHPCDPHRGAEEWWPLVDAAVRSGESRVEHHDPSRLARTLEGAHGELAGERRDSGAHRCAVRPERVGAEWVGAEWVGAEWVGAEWVGAEWVGAERVGAERVRPRAVSQIVHVGRVWPTRAFALTPVREQHVLGLCVEALAPQYFDQRQRVPQVRHPGDVERLDDALLVGVREDLVEAGSSGGSADDDDAGTVGVPVAVPRDEESVGEGRRRFVPTAVPIRIDVGHGRLIPLVIESVPGLADG